MPCNATYEYITESHATYYRQLDHLFSNGYLWIQASVCKYLHFSNHVCWDVSVQYVCSQHKYIHAPHTYTTYIYHLHIS